MKDTAQRYEAGLADTLSRAGAMKRVLIQSQFLPNGSYISDPSDRDNGIIAAAAEDPLYSSMGEEMGARQALSDASAIRDYSAMNNGALPSDDLLAAAHGTLENIYSNNQSIAESGKSDMLLSSMAESNLSSEKGVSIRATTAALTLPVMLANPLNDIVSYLPARKNEVEIFEIERVAGKTLGDFKKNQIIDELSYGQYSTQRQRYPFAKDQLPDGSKKQFTFNTKSHTPAGVMLPVRPTSIKIYFNRTEAAIQLDGGDLYGQVEVGGAKVILSGTVDHDTGIIVLDSDKVLPNESQLHAEFEVDIEANGDLIPTIDHKMKGFKFRPHSRVIAADASIMSAFTMNTEFGVDINAMNLSSMRDWLANERALKQLDDLMFLVKEEYSFDAAVPENSHETWKDRFEYIKSLFLTISQTMIDTNKESGLKGMYCGTLFSTFVQMLPPSLFQRAAGYVKTSRIHFIGTILGSIKVFEVPFTSLVPAHKALGYGRTEKLGKAPYYTGDVVPPTLYSHEVTKGLRKGNTLWANGYDNASPTCDKFLVLIELKNYTAS